MRRCPVDGVEFEPRSGRHEFCSATCRQRAHRGGVASVTVLPAGEKPDGLQTAATRAALVAAGRDGSWLGAMALSLSQRIDESTATQGYNGLTSDLRATMAEAMKDVADDSDELDEIREAALRLIRGGRTA